MRRYRPTGGRPFRPEEEQCVGREQQVVLDLPGDQGEIEEAERLEFVGQIERRPSGDRAEIERSSHQDGVRVAALLQRRLERGPEVLRGAAYGGQVNQGLPRVRRLLINLALVFPSW